MENVMKRSLNQEELSLLIHQAFGEDKAISQATELQDGWFNTAYDIMLSNGLRTVLKIAPRDGEGALRYERNVMKAEIGVLKLLKEEGSLPVPGIYFTGLDPQGGECFMMEFMEGSPLNKAREALTKTELDAIQEELGQLNRRLNEIPGERFGYYAMEEEQGDSWYEIFTGMVLGLLADARDKQIVLPAEDGEICSAVAVRRASLEEVKRPKLVHWDLWDGNVFVHGGKVTGLIDCERALWGDPLMEFYFRELAGEQSAFLKGYGKTSFSPAEHERMELYDLYLALIMHIECTYRGYVDEHHHKWAFEQLSRAWERVSQKVR